MSVRSFGTLVTLTEVDISSHETIVTSGGTLTVPSGTGTVVGQTTPAALTGKTITDSSNTVTADGIRTTTTTVDVSASAAPVADQALVATGSTAAIWQSLGDLAGSDAYVLWEQQAEGVAGSAAPAGSYFVRTINNIAGPPGGTDVTIAGIGSITLTPGDYVIRVTAAASNCGLHTIRIFRPGDATVILDGGSSQYNSSGHLTTSFAKLVGRHTVTGPGSETVEVQHWATLAGTYGSPRSVASGEPEVYLVCAIERDIGS